jgi:uncharacterized membrane protein
MVGFRGMGEELVVAVFDEEGDAWSAVTAAAEVAAQRGSGVLDSCLVVRSEDGAVHIRETSELTTAERGWDGAASGLLAGVVFALPLAGAAVGAGLGVFAARRHDVGITNEFEQAVSEKLEPGRAAAVAIVTSDVAADVEKTAQRRGAWASRLTLEDATKLTAV